MLNSSRYSALLALILPAVVGSVPAAQAGSVAAWGGNLEGQCFVPPPNQSFVAVSAGTEHSLGLKADGSIVAWGENRDGQLNVPAPNSGFVGLDAGRWHSLGLKADGTVVGWGWNIHGQCDPPEPNGSYVAVAAGGAHSLALKSDGSVAAWGDNSVGQCNVPAPNIGFIAISAGGYHSLALRSDGSVVAWGLNYLGQCDVPAPNSGFIAVAAGGDFSLGLEADGSIIGWGDNVYGQCVPPPPNLGFSVVSAGDLTTIGLKSDGSLVVWGSGENGQAELPIPNQGFAGVACGASHALACTAQDLPDGACCTEIGSCALTIEMNCREPDSWAGPDTGCHPNFCATGACCDPGGLLCRESTRSDCAASGGTFQGSGTRCEPGFCELSTAGGNGPEETVQARVFPNPSSGAPGISYSVIKGGVINIDIFDASGAEVRRLTRLAEAPGRHEAVWDGLDERGARVSSGIYLAVVRTPQSSAVTKFVLVRRGR